jgi:hypothetical protein
VVNTAVNRSPDSNNKADKSPVSHNKADKSPVSSNKAVSTEASRSQDNSPVTVVATASTNAEVFNRSQLSGSSA